MAKQVKAELDEVHGETAPTLRTVSFWINEFKRGWTSAKDEARAERPVKVTAPEIIERIHRIVMEDHRMKMCEIAEIVGVSVGSVDNILHEKLEIKKMGARIVDHRRKTHAKRHFRAVFDNA